MDRQKKLLEQYGKKNLIQCKVCGKWFRQVGTHVVQAHGYSTAREYRKDFGFDLKRGQLPEDYRKLKRSLVFKTKTVNNLKKGIKFLFKKGEIRNYQRSKQTLERLRCLYSFNKNK